MQLLTEVLRPKTYKQAILLDRVQKSLNIDDLNNGIISQNMIFHSKSGGLGKTSICKIIENQYHSIRINLSIDRGIDIARSLEDFCIAAPSFDIDSKKSNRTALLTAAHRPSSARLRLSRFSTAWRMPGSSFIARMIDESCVSPEACIP